jgi:hypothetical protein
MRRGDQSTLYELLVELVTAQEKADQRVFAKKPDKMNSKYACQRTKGQVYKPYIPESPPPVTTN